MKVPYYIYFCEIEEIISTRFDYPFIEIRYDAFQYLEDILSEYGGCAINKMAKEIYKITSQEQMTVDILKKAKTDINDNAIKRIITLREKEIKDLNLPKKRKQNLPISKIMKLPFYLYHKNVIAETCGGLYYSDIKSLAFQYVEDFFEECVYHKIMDKGPADDQDIDNCIEGSLYKIISLKQVTTDMLKKARIIERRNIIERTREQKTEELNELIELSKTTRI